MTCRPRASVRLLVVALAALAVPAAAQDLDRDGLSDRLEQALLERFLPTFVLSAGECDGLPASLAPFRVDPDVAARDGTIYGHVALRRAVAREHVEVEVKYFHLWSRDCGRPSHALDVERVAALLQAPSIDAPLGDWSALYWYAAAHEGTVCDASSGATGATLRATAGGPYVYVSRGKHASYLLRGQCKWGCGSDLCDPGPPIPRAGVVNLGEVEAPLNGALWVRSRRWALAGKLGTDFEASLRARFDTEAPTTVLALRIPLRPFQAPILGGDTGLDALLAAGEATAAAGQAGIGAAATAVEASGRAVGQAVTRTFQGIARFLGLR